MNAPGEAVAIGPGTAARGIALLRDLLPVLGLIALLLFFSEASDYFLNLRNFQRLATDSATLILVAYGMTLVILLGEIDLSVSALTGLLSVALAQILALGLPWPLAVLAGVAGGAAFGLLNGALTALGGIPSFIVTLGSSAIATGCAFVLTGAISVPIMDDTFLDLFYSVAVLGLPVPLLIVLVACAAVAVLLRATAFGRELYAIGANAEAARLSGVAVRRNKLLVFAIMGTLVGIGAVLSASRLGSGVPNSSPALTLDAIAAVIIGGASLFGGRASLLRTLLGAMLIAVLNNGMVLMNLNSDVQYIIKGVIILVAVVLERLSTLARAGAR